MRSAGRQIVGHFYLTKNKDETILVFFPRCVTNWNCSTLTCHIHDRHTDNQTEKQTYKMKYNESGA